MKWSTPEVKQLNKELIRKTVKDLGGCTKSDVAKETALSVATCNTLLNEMLETGEILKQDQEVAKMGRPADRFVYNAEYHHVMGLCVRSTNSLPQIDVCIADALGKVVFQESRQIDVPDQSSIDEIVKEFMAKYTTIQSISIGIPGVAKGGIVERCDIESLTGADLQGAYAGKYGISVEAHNDLEFISCGVYNTKFQETGNLAVVRFPDNGEGFAGSGFVIRGRVLTGTTAFAGELSYITEGFGITRENVKKRCEDHDGLVEYMGQIALVIAATVDPEYLVIMSSNIEDEDLDAIREFLTGIVTEQHVPALVLERDIMEAYREGMIHAAINRLDFPLSRPF